MKIKKYILLCFALISVLIALSYQIQTQIRTEWTFNDSTHAKIWYGMAIAIAISTIWFSIKNFKQTNHRIYLLPSLIIIGIFILSALVICIKLKEESPSLLKAEYDGNVHYMKLNLKIDGTYRIGNHNSYKGGEYYNGTYLLRNDTVILDKSISLGKGAVRMSKIWTVRQDSIFFDLYYPDSNELFDTGFFITKERGGRKINL